MRAEYFLYAFMLALLVIAGMALVNAQPQSAAGCKPGYVELRREHVCVLGYAP